MERQARRCGTTADRSRTRDRILRAATKVFAEHGFREATTRMICAEAAVNSALVNYHFRSKADLYRAVIVSELFRGKSRLQQHQLVYKALGQRMGGELHALALSTSAPQ